MNHVKMEKGKNNAVKDLHVISQSAKIYLKLIPTGITTKMELVQKIMKNVAMNRVKINVAKIMNVLFLKCMDLEPQANVEK
mmetsp:Transcript_74585/g.112384  ORF Transcript_74585/g.112384 Transcript_74585/m.112384 type:complete len:81 (+) Transcript_74585:505-747(+)